MTPNLSPHFTQAELQFSDTALRLGIDNTIPPEMIPSAIALCENILEPIRTQFGPFSPTSGFRCTALNARIGGATQSQHMLAQAADIVLPGTTRFDLATWIHNNLDYDQLILELYTPGEPESGWVHCSYVGKGQNRKQDLTFPPPGRAYIPGLQQ